MQDWKKSSPQDCVSPRGHYAPRLFQLSSSFSEINSSAKIRMALKRTVLYRLKYIVIYCFSVTLDRIWGFWAFRIRYFYDSFLFFLFSIRIPIQGNTPQSEILRIAQKIPIRITKKKIFFEASLRDIFVRSKKGVPILVRVTLLFFVFIWVAEGFCSKVKILI